MNLRRKYQTPLERISERVSQVGSPDKLSTAVQPQSPVDPLSMGESYSSFYRIKQQKEEQQRREYKELIRQREQQIDKLKEDVIDIKQTITNLENKLEEYRYPTPCDISVLTKLLEISVRWLKHPLLKQSKLFLTHALIQHFAHPNKRQFVYGRLFYWMLGIFQVINSRE